MDIDSLIHGISTPVSSKVKLDRKIYNMIGTGFHYHVMGNMVENTQWRQITKIWLVTNRHIIFQKINKIERIPDELTFKLRKMEDNKISWDIIKLNKEQILKRTRVSSNKSIDIAIIDILDLVNKQSIGGSKKGIRYIAPFGVNNSQLLGNSKLKVEIGDSILVIGYPYGYYNITDLYPVVKSGTVSSSLYSNLHGKPAFLIDARLYSGSSGSLVISTPTNDAIIDGRRAFNPVKQFVFLGIFSGSTYLKDEKNNDLEFDAGIVWYGRLIDNIINEDVSFQ